jgi:hypothetical protein
MKETNFETLAHAQDWYGYAAGNEFDVTWGSVKLWKSEVPQMKHVRSQMAWLDGELLDLHVRKRSVVGLAKSILSPTNELDREIDRLWPLIPVKSITPRLANAICTLYNKPPVRTFHTKKEINEGYEEIYASLNVNQAMQRAYRAALITNTVAIIPDWKTKKIKVLTSDYFRMKTDGNGNVTELWLIHGNNGYKETEFEVWTANERTFNDYEGKFKSVERNPYGRIPATILQLNESEDIYGAGISVAAEINAWANFIRLLSTRIGAFQSFSVALGVNLQLAEGTKVGPGHFIQTLSSSPLMASSLNSKSIRERRSTNSC